MKKIGIGLLLALSLWAENGMIRYESHYNVEETTRRLVTSLRERGVTLFKVIDHSENARKIGEKLAAMKLVIFGHPKMGTPFLQCAPTVGLDLPQKMLIYETNGTVMIAYNAPAYLFWRHKIGASCALPLQKKMGRVLENLAKNAAGVR